MFAKNAQQDPQQMLNKQHVFVQPNKYFLNRHFHAQIAQLILLQTLINLSVSAMPTISQRMEPVFLTVKIIKSLMLSLAIVNAEIHMSRIVQELVFLDALVNNSGVELAVYVFQAELNMEHADNALVIPYQTA